MKGKVCEGVLRQFKDYAGTESAPDVAPSGVERGSFWDEMERHG